MASVLQAGCGECGGEGCEDRGNGLTDRDCCTSTMVYHAKCSAVNQAPCVVDVELSGELWAGLVSDGD